MASVQPLSVVDINQLGIKAALGEAEQRIQIHHISLTGIDDRPVVLSAQLSAGKALAAMGWNE